MLARVSKHCFEKNEMSNVDQDQHNKKLHLGSLLGVGAGAVNRDMNLFSNPLARSFNHSKVGRAAGEIVAKERAISVVY